MKKRLTRLIWDKIKAILPLVILIIVLLLFIQLTDPSSSFCSWTNSTSMVRCTELNIMRFI